MASNLKYPIYLQGESLDWPILIDDTESTPPKLGESPDWPDNTNSSPLSEAIWELEYPNKLLSASKTLSSRSIHRLSFRQLGAFNDIITQSFIDRIFFDGTIRKSGSEYLSFLEDGQSVISIIRNLLSRGKISNEVQQQIFKLPGIERFSGKFESEGEHKGFRRLLRMYLDLFLRDCPFEISRTNRYTITTYETTITARIPIPKGTEIKYLRGIRAVLTEDEADFLQRKGQNFSVLETSRSQATSYGFGPSCFSNHDCRANSHLTTDGPSALKVIALKDIKVGQEITVSYAPHYFGDNNYQCLCKDCEHHQRNGWSQNTNNIPDDSNVLHRTPGDYRTGWLPSEWFHPESCMASALSAPCPVCERHHSLYGFQWPRRA